MHSRKNINSTIPNLNDIKSSINENTNQFEKELNLGLAKYSCAEIKDKYDALLQEKQQLTTSGTSRSGRVRASTARVINANDLENINFQLVETKSEMREQQKVMTNAKKEFDLAKKDYDEWKCSFPWETDLELIEYSKGISKPVLDYYVKLFQEDDGDNFHTRKAAMACKLFDPLYLKGKQQELHSLGALSF